MLLQLAAEWQSPNFSQIHDDLGRMQSNQIPLGTPNGHDSRRLHVDSTERPSNTRISEKSPTVYTSNPADFHRFPFISNELDMK